MPTNSTSMTMQGWTPSPNGRGSLDILWLCLTTIFLSTWSAICLNVPEPGDTTWRYVKRKTWLTFIAVMGPEYLLGFALGEWQSARESVAHLKRIRQDNRWTMKHAFFADMGGFVLKTNDGVSFFLDTKQIHWLLDHQAVSMNEFEKHFLLNPKSIDDRNKSDTFVRVIAVGQALWFCVNIIARGVQGLAVTTLEVTTIGIIVDSVLIYYIWRDKPADVESMDTVEINMSLQQIIVLEHEGAVRSQPYFRTPLDFVSRKIWVFNLIYHYLMNILKGMWPRSWNVDNKSSLGRRSENDVLPVTGIGMAVGMLFTFIFVGTNFIAWNFHFPTATERLLWRLSSCALVVIIVAGAAFVELIFDDERIKSMQEKVRQHRKTVEEFEASGEKAQWMHLLHHKLRKVAMKIRNNSRDVDPNLDVSLLFVFTTVSGFAAYTVCRLYILVEDLIAFRSLPADAYKTVDWWSFLPHVS